MQLSFFLVLPNILLSGYIFPQVATPEPAQWIGASLPLTFFLKVIRGVLLKGLSFAVLWPELLILFGFAAGLVVSVRHVSTTIE